MHLDVCTASAREMNHLFRPSRGKTPNIMQWFDYKCCDKDSVVILSAALGIISSSRLKRVLTAHLFCPEGVH